MITTIIFDFGDIFINLEKQKTAQAFQKIGIENWSKQLEALNYQFELGQISRTDFLEGIQVKTNNASISEVLATWNSILGDFPKYRLDFLKELSKKHRLFLLSNTDAIHIAFFEEQFGRDFYEAFYQCFEKVYFSFDLKMRKPNVEIYQHLIAENHLIASQTLFVDDKKDNTDAALQTGLIVWNLQVGQEDVVDLYERKIL
jgi:glucose-1-phosphatase